MSSHLRFLYLLNQRVRIGDVGQTFDGRSIIHFEIEFVADFAEQNEHFRVFLFGQKIDLKIQMISLFIQAGLAVLAHHQNGTG